MKTTLISADDIGYKKHNRGHAQRYRQGRPCFKTNTVERALGRELQRFEQSISNWFATLTRNYPNRILRYKTQAGVLKYQEIDFIAQGDRGLKFCELKLKQRYDPCTDEKYLGLNQLAVTTKIAREHYPICGALAICIDMSFLYEGVTSGHPENYVSVEELSRELNQSTVTQPEFIWLDVREVLAIGLREGWLMPEQIDRLKECHQLQFAPMLHMPVPADIPTNRPVLVG